MTTFEDYRKRAKRVKLLEELKDALSELIGSVRNQEETATKWDRILDLMNELDTLPAPHISTKREEKKDG